jgi:hypothetical protein
MNELTIFAALAFAYAFYLGGPFGVLVLLILVACIVSQLVWLTILGLERLSAAIHWRRP